MKDETDPLDPTFDVTLAAATDAEIWAVLGVQALPLVQKPGATLSEGRSGAFVVDGSDALGKEFQHSYFEKVARLFLKTWSAELKRALCKSSKTYGSVRHRVTAQTDIIAGLVAAGLSQHVPALAPYTGLIAVLSTLVARTGIEGFCVMLSELQDDTKPPNPTRSSSAAKKKRPVKKNETAIPGDLS